MHKNFVYNTVEPLKMDSPYYGSLHNADKWQWSRIVPYSILYIATSVYSGNLPTPSYGHQCHAPVDKINTNFSPKMDNLDLLVQKC